ncbi:hypothetical protein JTB14_022995 [Gonioctena quinquepunctata]|nr:hypothetical protein JTB14_022995 [Gonioctena quinquepunctata]
MVEDKTPQTQYRRCRSMSDGAASRWKKNDSTFEVFPSLPNSVLEKMGLRGEGPREHLSDAELEGKFTSLALAFTIDSTTVKERRERQKRHRDQTEMNLSTEIERLKEKLTFLQPLCTDCEKAEMLTSILDKMNVLMNATSLVSLAAERFGSVQHEERLTESVSLMLTHVQMLKQQRDLARRQLEYTKRVLQKSSEPPSTSPTNSKISLPINSNMRVIGRRRASIATITQQIMDKPASDSSKKVTRRTIDLSPRTTPNRNVRPNRLELGGELDNIKEGYIETLIDYEPPEDESQNDIIVPEPESNSSDREKVQPPVDLTKLSLRERINHEYRTLEQNFNEKYKQWIDDGTLHEVCSFCALVCFSFGLIIMANILIEYENAKWGTDPSHIFWFWSSGNDGRASITRK